MCSQPYYQGNSIQRLLLENQPYFNVEVYDIIHPWNFTSKILCDPTGANWDSELSRIKYNNIPRNRELLAKMFKASEPPYAINECYKNYLNFPEDNSNILWIHQNLTFSIQTWLMTPYSFFAINEFIISSPIRNIEAFVGKNPESKKFKKYCKMINNWMVSNGEFEIPCVGYNQRQLREQF